ncbi:hypothetical protein QQP08_008618 [Theobroma cacao]|nr:hypothetical protein QQP08_008618 [Theobroma cacao]
MKMIHLFDKKKFLELLKVIISDSLSAKSENGPCPSDTNVCQIICLNAIDLKHRLHCADAFYVDSGKSGMSKNIPPFL